MKHRGGFTLLELLVVIVIIANWAAGNISYLYYAYRQDTNPRRPAWLDSINGVSSRGNPNQWLMSDWLEGDAVSAHRLGKQTVNCLCVDGHMKVVPDNPRAAYGR